MTNQEAATLVQHFASDWAAERLSEKTYLLSQYWEALTKAAECLVSDPVHAAGGVYCHECYWFDTQGYEKPDPEMPELQMGYCAHWKKDTQACEFCSRGG